MVNVLCSWQERRRDREKKKRKTERKQQRFEATRTPTFGSRAKNHSATFPLHPPGS